MTKKNDLTKISRFMTLVLRHRPEMIDLSLNRAGWASVYALRRGLIAHGFDIDDATIERIVAADEKNRFALSDDGRQIRANQGHSLPLELGFVPIKPPPILFHGTATKSLDSIFRDGLVKRSRQYVHLSLDESTAREVGQRHGVPVVLMIKAAAMVIDGYDFFLSFNGIWLTDWVPPAYIEALWGLNSV